MKEIYTPYFDWIEKNFGNFASRVKREDLSVEDVVKEYLGQPNNRQAFWEKMPNIFRKVDDFWKDIYKSMTGNEQVQQIENPIGEEE